MKTILFNDHNLEKREMDQQVTKVRVALLNSQNELYLAHYNGVYLLPGGKVEVGEDLVTAATREIYEEAGIVLNLEDYEPHLLVIQYLSHYPKRTGNGYHNKLTKTYYYVVVTDQVLDISKRQLSEREKVGGFEIIQVNLTEILPLLRHNDTDNPRNLYFTRELQAVIDELKNMTVPF